MGFWDSITDLIGGIVNSGAPEQLAGPGVETAAAAGEGFGSGLADLASSAVSGTADLIGSGISNLGGLAKGILPVAQLGLSGLAAANTFKGMEQAAEQNKIARRAQQASEQAIAPVSQFGAEQLRLAQAGQIPAAEQARIDQWVAGAKQQIRDYLARAGMGDSTALAEREALIDQQALAMKAQILDSMRRGGVGALTSAAGTYGNIQEGAGQQGAAIEQLIAQANEALGKMAGSTR